MLIDLDCIHTKLQKASQILEINEQPTLNFEYGGYGSRYEELTNNIIINLNSINNLKVGVLPFIKIKLVKDIDIIIFSLYHELGHCFQYQKFPKRFLNCDREWREFTSNIIRKNVIEKEDFEKYRKLKLEKCSDKIAYILFEKLEKE